MGHDQHPLSHSWSNGYLQEKWLWTLEVTYPETKYHAFIHPADQKSLIQKKIAMPYIAEVLDMAMSRPSAKTRNLLASSTIRLTLRGSDAFLTQQRDKKAGNIDLHFTPSIGPFSTKASLSRWKAKRLQRNIFRRHFCDTSVCMSGESPFARPTAVLKCVRKGSCLSCVTEQELKEEEERESYILNRSPAEIKATARHILHRIWRHLVFST